jgi:hypothetical protein
MTALRLASARILAFACLQTQCCSAWCQAAPPVSAAKQGPDAVKAVRAEFEQRKGRRRVAYLPEGPPPAGLR